MMRLILADWYSSWRKIGITATLPASDGLANWPHYANLRNSPWSMFGLQELFLLVRAGMQERNNA
ncbi:MAG TPA: hypothetical protein VH079_18645 [Terriglobales bacterium]|nr:hypothetical protein [Terriglobales bacterium]